MLLGDSVLFIIFTFSLILKTKPLILIEDGK